MKNAKYKLAAFHTHKYTLTFPKNELTIQNQLPHSASYLIGSKSCSGCTVRWVRFRDRHVWIIELHTRPSNPQSISLDYNRRNSSHQTTSTVNKLKKKKKQTLIQLFTVYQYLHFRYSHEFTNFLANTLRKFDNQDFFYNTSAKGTAKRIICNDIVLM